MFSVKGWRTPNSQLMQHRQSTGSLYEPLYKTQIYRSWMDFTMRNSSREGNEVTKIRISSAPSITIRPLVFRDDWTSITTCTRVNLADIES